MLDNSAPIDFNEPLLSLAEAARTLPLVDGRPPHPSSLWRWCPRGLRGVHLNYCRVGRRVCTTRSALVAFTRALADADQQETPRAHQRRDRVTSRSDAARARDIEHADRLLQEAGI